LNHFGVERNVNGEKGKKISRETKTLLHSKGVEALAKRIGGCCRPVSEAPHNEKMTEKVKTLLITKNPQARGDGKDLQANGQKTTWRLRGTPQKDRKKKSGKEKTTTRREPVRRAGTLEQPRSKGRRRRTGPRVASALFGEVHIEDWSHIKEGWEKTGLH